METSEHSSAEDARELRRGVLVTYLGYVLKLGMPVLIAFATRTYGATRWGLFLSVQAVVLLAVRLCLIGLDKALLWAIPSRPAQDALVGMRPVLLLVAVSTALVSAVLWFAPELVPFLDPPEAATLRVMSLGLAPFALSELLLHAAMGRRRMELQVAVREILNPAVQIGAALGLFGLGWHATGLAWSFVLAHVLGLVVAWFGFRHLFRDVPWPAREAWALPKPLVRYAAPLWLAEMGNTIVLRLDTLVLAALTDPFTVGIWGVVGQFANALRQIRRAYDPIVTAISARIAVQHDPRRLAETYSYASQMVSLTQLPVFAFLLCFAGVILPLYGPGFERGEHALVWLAVFFLVSGGTGLSGLVVNGYGRSGLTLANVLLTIVVQCGLSLWLVPSQKLVGAAIAVGGSLLLTNFVQLLEMRLITGSFNYTRRSRFTFAVLFASAVAAGASLLLARALELGDWATRGLAMLGFALVYLLLCGLGWRSGVLQAPRAKASGLPREETALA